MVEKAGHGFPHAPALARFPDRSAQGLPAGGGQRRAGVRQTIEQGGEFEEPRRRRDDGNDGGPARWMKPQHLRPQKLNIEARRIGEVVRCRLRQEGNAQIARQGGEVVVLGKSAGEDFVFDSCAAERRAIRHARDEACAKAGGGERFGLADQV
ncbi:hypothetical protein [Allorhizobium borbori]|uniref:hypothetical protein n=1 Tax=Allorhizobium borbori TaxID=485907 RepID=UPI001F4436E7|nr:hypothetical protein [Allorhizobium borbori]